MIMTPEQKIKHLILVKAFEWKDEALPAVTASNIDVLYEEADEDCTCQDALSEIREGEVVTKLPCEWSRHYETKSVAAKTPDGSWVGWTYWYGGGKYGNPEEIDWIDTAYDLTCVEEEKIITVRTFSKVDAA